MGTSVAVSQATIIFEIRLLELANRLDCVAREAPVSIHLFLPSTGLRVCVITHGVLFVWVLGVVRPQSVRVSH